MRNFLVDNLAKFTSSQLKKNSIPIKNFFQEKSFVSANSIQLYLLLLYSIEDGMPKNGTHWSDEIGKKESEDADVVENALGDKGFDETSVLIMILINNNYS